MERGRAHSEDPVGLVVTEAAPFDGGDWVVLLGGVVAEVRFATAATAIVIAT